MIFDVGVTDLTRAAVGEILYGIFSFTVAFRSQGRFPIISAENFQKLVLCNTCSRRRSLRFLLYTTGNGDYAPPSLTTRVSSKLSQ